MKENKNDILYILNKTSKYNQLCVRQINIKNDNRARTKSSSNFDADQNEILNAIINKLQNRGINFKLMNSNLRNIDVVYDFTRDESRYIPEINKIVLHEYKYNFVDFVGMLFNVASTKVETMRIYSGLSQMNIESKKTLGSGLNNGYTQLLTTMYYGASYKSDIMEKVANRLTYIVDNDDLQKYYFNADLKGLITELSNYDSTNNVYKFLNYLDIVDNLSRKSVSKIEKRTYDKALLKTSLILTKWYVKKKRNEYNNGIIDENKMNDDIDSFINILNFDELDAIYNNEEVYFPIKYKCHLIEPLLK